MNRIKQWKQEQVCPFFGCFTADSLTAAGRHHLYNNGSLVLFSTAIESKGLKVEKMGEFDNHD